MKMITKTVHLVDYNDLESTVKREYGYEWSFVADQECNNDSAQTFLGRERELDNWERERLNNFITTGAGTFLFHSLMQDMINRNVLPEGEYVIKVSW